MTKPNEAVKIEFIKDCLRKGEDRRTIMAKYTKKWQKSTRSFDRMLKRAKDSLGAEIKQIETKTQENIQKEINDRKSKIMTSLDRQELLSTIANSSKFDSDRIRAMAELNKMAGDYAPAKTQTDGEMIIKVIRE